MELKYKKENVYEKLNEKEIKEMKEYTKGYLEFLNYGKTEYLCVEYAERILRENGFKDISKYDILKPGDKLYFINKDKSLYASVIGKEDIMNGTNIIGAHIDSPRLDLKPMPLYEKRGMGLLKTQYYGGIKKYQWLAIPLAMHGVVYNEKGEKIKIAMGEEKDDFCFTITDLLPHLAREQMKLQANEFIDPEKLSIAFGSIKAQKNEDDKNEEAIKENILKILNKKYGIKEIDFVRSEISFVPAFRAKYIGIDESMIGGYGQDDRVCSYATIKSLIDIANSDNIPSKTIIAMIVDKEEIGSYGNTSMSSNIFDMFVNEMVVKIKKIDEENKMLDIYKLYYNSKMLSADVSTCVDPSYEELSDVQNGNILGSGVSLEKYTGSGGKYSSSDATAKFMYEVTNIFEKNNVMYQLGTLGKIEKGGGGTIAYILANKGVDVVDCGTPVLSMHAPLEVTSEADVYMTYRACKVFFEN